MPLATAQEEASQPARTEASLVRRLWPFALLLAALLLLWIFRHRFSFDFRAFLQQLRFVSPLHVFLALLAIYMGYVLRAARWAVLLSPVRKASTAELLPSQLIGFTAVALFGRIADLARPYLVARKLKMPVATQLAVYSIERAFDLGAAAILFSLTLAFAPHNMPHHEAFARAGLLSLAATVFLAGFAVTLRLAGDRLAALAERVLGLFSPKLATSIGARLRTFQEGFQTIASLRQFAGALALSLLMWVGIALTYLESARAFVGSPTLGSMNFTGIMLLLATSLGASLLQLPVLGWFTQIAAIAAAYRGFYGVPFETASACGALTLLTTSLSIIPAGLLASRMQGISLRETTKSSEDEAAFN